MQAEDFALHQHSEHEHADDRGEENQSTPLPALQEMAAARDQPRRNEQPGQISRRRLGFFRYRFFDCLLGHYRIEFLSLAFSIIRHRADALYSELWKLTQLAILRQELEFDPAQFSHVSAQADAHPTGWSEGLGFVTERRGILRNLAPRSRVQ